MRSLTPLGVLGLLLARLIRRCRHHHRHRDRARTARRSAPPSCRPAMPQLKMTVSVLTDNQGTLRRREPAGRRLPARRSGRSATRPSPRAASSSPPTRTAAQDFALQTGMVRLDRHVDLPGPAASARRARQERCWSKNCMSCHGFQSKMAATVRDEDGWRVRVEFMREAMRSSLADRRGFSDQQAEDVAYLHEQDVRRELGAAEVAGRAAGLQGHGDRRSATRRSRSSTSTSTCRGRTASRGPRIPTRTAISGPRNTASSNRVTQFNPKTGEMKEFRGAEPGPGADPFGGAGARRLGLARGGRLQEARPLGPEDADKVTEYQDDWRKHTIAVHPDGSIWSTGGLTRFDPKTETFTHITEVPTAYGIGVDKEGTVWFTEMTKTGTIGKVDPKTLKVTKYIPPFRDRPRRMQVADDGTIWFAVFDDSRIARFDPKTETFKDYPLPHKQTQALRARHRDRQVALVLVVLSRPDRPARSGHRQGDRISDALYRQRHARLLPRQGRPHVVRLRRPTTRSATSTSRTGSAAPRRAELPACPGLAA